MPAKIHLKMTLLPNKGPWLKTSVLVNPLHVYVFSFTHNAAVLLNLRCAYLKNQTNFFYFYVAKQNVAYTRLEVIARTQLCTTNTVTVQRQTNLLLCTLNLLPSVSNGHKQGRRQSRLKFIILLSITNIMQF